MLGIRKMCGKCVVCRLLGRKSVWCTLCWETTEGEVNCMPAKKRLCGALGKVQTRRDILSGRETESARYTSWSENKQRVHGKEEGNVRPTSLICLKVTFH